MTEAQYNGVSVLLGGAEILAAFCICMMYDGKRPRFASRLCGLLVCYVGVACLFAFVPMGAAEKYRVMLYDIAAVAAAAGMLTVCFDKPFRHVLFCGNVALAARYFAVRLSSIVCVLFTENGVFGEFSPYAFLIRAAFFAATCTAFCYFMFARAYRGNVDVCTSNGNAVLCPVFLAVATALEALGLLLDGFELVYYMVFYICEAMYGFIMLLINYALLKQGQSDFELSVVRQLWNEDRKHYEVQKETVDIINIKCHDLRHQIRALTSDHGISAHALGEIENAVDIYDSIAKTGSEVLDVILSDFSLRCKNGKVMLTYMADGRAIGFMDDMDVYSLFGNLLENALEYETSSVDEKNRFISLTVKYNKGYLSVHCENYFYGDAVFENGIVVTSKPDKNYHGFGMKSMKTIAEKYGGNFNAKVEDDMFQADVLLPIPDGAYGGG